MDDFAESVVAATNRVYVAGSTSSGETSEAVVLAYDASGQLVWSYVDARPGTGGINRAMLSADGTRLYLAGFIDGHGLMAINTTDGTLVWTGQPSSNINGQDIVLSPDGSRVFVAAGYEGLFAFYAGDGSLAWVAPATIVAAQQVAVSPDGLTVYAGGNGPLVAFDSADGDVLWSGPQLAATHPVATPDGAAVLSLFRPYGSTEFFLQSRAAATGTALWTSTRAFDAYALTSDGDTAVGLSRRGQLVALDAQTGSELWVSTVPGGASVGLSPDDNLAVVFGGDSSMEQIAQATAYSVASGARQWTATLPASSTTFETPVDHAFSPDASTFYVGATRSQALGDADVLLAAFES